MHDGVNFTSVVCACVGELVHLSESMYFCMEFGVLWMARGKVVVQGLVYQRRVISRQVMVIDMVDNSTHSGSGVLT
jgi:hypothetical protein